MKQCGKCKKILSLNEFVKCKITKDGLHYWCRECNKKYKLLYYNNNKDIILSKCKIYREHNKENRSNTDKKYRESHKEELKEKRKEYFKEYREKNKEICRLRSRISKSKPLGKLKARIKEQKRRKYINESDDGTINYDSITELLNRQQYKCAITGKKFRKDNDGYIYHIDHRIPLSKGGKHSISNIQLTLPEENWKKGTKLIYLL